MTSQESPSVPPPRRKLTYEQRVRVTTLADIGMTHEKIASTLGITRRQVGYTLRCGSLTPTKPSGRPLSLTDEQVDMIENYIIQSRETRQMSYRELASGPFRDFGVSHKVIGRALKKRGYARTVARVVSPQPDQNRRNQQ